MGTKGEKTPRPTKNKTPRPTVWSPPKTPRPTSGEKTPKPTKNKKTPKPTNPPKTPRPTVSYVAPEPSATYSSPQPTITYVTPEPTKPCPVLRCQNPCKSSSGSDVCGANYECRTKETFLDDKGRCQGCDAFDKCEYVGWQLPKTPMTGCAENTGKKTCSNNKRCTWKSGYPPMEFSEDADYQLLADESFFAVDGSVVEMIDNMDSNMLMISGVVFVAVLLAAIKLCSAKKNKKDVYVPINDEKAYGSVAVVSQ